MLSCPRHEARVPANWSLTDLVNKAKKMSRFSFQNSLGVPNILPSLLCFKYWRSSWLTFYFSLRLFWKGNSWFIQVDTSIEPALCAVRILLRDSQLATFIFLKNIISSAKRRWLIGRQHGHFYACHFSFLRRFCD